LGDHPQGRGSSYPNPGARWDPGLLLALYLALVAQEGDTLRCRVSVTHFSWRWILRFLIIEQTLDCIGNLLSATMQHIVCNHLRGVINNDSWQWSISRLIGHAPIDLIPEGLG
jgi:hypothetical protein